MEDTMAMDNENSVNTSEVYSNIHYDPREIHIFRIESKNLAFKSSTLEIYQLDEMAYEFLTSPKTAIEKYSLTEISDLYAALLKLGFFDSLKDDKIDNLSSVNASQPISQLMMIVSQDCNLNCIYCLADKGAFYKRHTPMPPEIGIKSIDFLMHESGDAKICLVSFTGGEPLLNFPTIKITVEYGKKMAEKYNKEILFLLSTNGSVLDDKILQFIKNYKIYLNLSLDGPPDVQNRCRPFKNGIGSYDIVVKNLKKLLEHYDPDRILIRTTITRYNLDMINTAEHFFQLGARRLSFGKAAPNAFCDYRIYGIDPNTAMGEIYLKNYLNFCKYMVECFMQRPEISFANMRDIANLHFRLRKPLGCGMGQYQVAISPNGEIYPCGVFIGLQNYLMGNLNQGFSRNCQSKYHQIISNRRKICNVCWARNICGGGCHAGDLLDDYKPISEIVCNFAQRVLEINLFAYAYLVDLVGYEYLNKRLAKYRAERTSAEGT